MKYLYVLVSDENDFYYEQAFLSIKTLRKYNPQAFVALLTDDKTEKIFANKKSNIRKLVNELKIKEFEDSISKINRSRILKTTMRNLIDGDFLYIDCDTIITADLNEIWEFKTELGMVGDANFDEIPDFMNKKHIHPETRKLRSTIKNKEFQNYKTLFNSGVILVKDNQKNRNFFDKWNLEWREYAKKGYYSDQFPLQITNWKQNFPIKLLPNAWNAQKKFGTIYLQNCKIFHYFWKKGTYSFSNYFLQLIREGKNLDEGNLDKILNLENWFEKPCILITNKDYEIYWSLRHRIIKYVLFPSLLLEKIRERFKKRG